MRAEWLRRAAATLAATLALVSCSGATPGSDPARTSSASGTASAATTTARAADPAIRLRFTGDMLPSLAMQAQAARDANGVGYDFGPMLAEVAPVVADADFSFCHQETAISDNNVGLSGYPSFNAPSQLAGTERAIGYDACSTASNHTVDLGQGGIDATLGTMDRANLGHTGSARSAAEKAIPAIYDVRGIRVGHLSYTYGLNGQPLPHPFSVNVIDPAAIRAAAAALRAAGAQVVVASLHFGTELDPTPSDYQEQVVAQVMAGPEVDLVIGHHAHVVQPAKQLPDGRWVFYGLGNFLAQQDVPANEPPPTHRDGVIVEVTFAVQPDGGYAATQAGYIPTFVDAPSDVVRLAPEFSRQRTATTLTSRGAPLLDLTPR